MQCGDSRILKPDRRATVAAEGWELHRFVEVDQAAIECIDEPRARAQLLLDFGRVLHDSGRLVEKRRREHAREDVWRYRWDGKSLLVPSEGDLFLVDPAGVVVARFRPGTQPDAPELIGAVEQTLPA